MLAIDVAYRTAEWDLAPLAECVDERGVLSPAGLLAATARRVPAAVLRGCGTRQRCARGSSGPNPASLAIASAGGGRARLGEKATCEGRFLDQPTGYSLVVRSR